LKRDLIFIGIFIVLIAAGIFSYKYYYSVSYKEKPLLETLEIEQQNIQAIYLYQSDALEKALTLKEQKGIEKFLSFFKDYNVKKMKVTGHTWKKNSIHASIFTEDESYLLQAEDEVIHNGQSLYKVLNGPINTDFLYETLSDYKK